MQIWLLENLMKPITAIFAIILTAALSNNAYAICPSIQTGYCCGTYWYQYDFAAGCAGTSGSVSTSTLSCGSTPAYQFTGSGTVSYAYTVGANDPIINSARWSAGLLVDFDDPNNSPYNTLNASVSVTHNGSTTSYAILAWDGLTGDTACDRDDYRYFSAVAGDTITVTITATNFNNGSTTIRAAAPFLFNQP
jgi:hypothetical protein